MMTNMKATTTLSLSAYEAACKGADWYFQYSDDHKAYTRGRGECFSLFQQSKESDQHREIFLKYCPFPDAPCYL